MPAVKQVAGPQHGTAVKPPFAVRQVSRRCCEVPSGCVRVHTPMHMDALERLTTTRGPPPPRTKVAVVGKNEFTGTI